jgi:hypothetical protein
MNANGWGSALLPQHVALLEERGITPELARERGCVSGVEKAQLERFGFGPAQRRPGLIIPLHNVIGEVGGFQLRPDEPRAVGGRVAKYETRSEQKMLLDVPPRVQPLLGDPEVPLVVTEGPLKADAAAGRGLVCVALLGVWNWRGSNGTGGRLALPDWESVALNGRRVFVCFDSDAMLKESVYGAMARLGPFLALRGAQVAYVYLPPGDHGTKTGLDDFLVDHDVGELLLYARTELHQPHAREPKPPPESFDDVDDEAGSVVLDDVVKFVKRFVRLSDVEADAVALWLAMCRAVDRFDFAARLFVKSAAKRSGKSRLLEVILLLLRLPPSSLWVLPSAAVVYRSIGDGTRPLLLDEVDRLFVGADRDSDITGVLNGGFQRGATVPRMVGEGAGLAVQEFPIFAPVAMAGIAGTGYPDTLVDRSIVIRLVRKTAAEPCEKLRARIHRPQADVLGRRLTAWLARHGDQLAYPETLPDVDDRAQDIWEPLIMVAALADGDWPARAAAACAALVADSEQSDGSAGVQLLADVRAVFADLGKDRIWSSVLAEKLCAIDESPWGGWHQDKGLRARDVAAIVREFGVRPRDVRIGSAVKRGYLLEDFADAFDRYLPPLDTDSGSSPDPDRYIRYTAGQTAKTSATDDPSCSTQKQPLTSSVADVADETGGNPDADGFDIDLEPF